MRSFFFNSWKHVQSNREWKRLLIALNHSSPVLFVTGSSRSSLISMYQGLPPALAECQCKRSSKAKQAGKCSSRQDVVRVVTHELAAKGPTYCNKNNCYVELGAAEDVSDELSGENKPSIVDPRAFTEAFMKTRSRRPQEKRTSSHAETWHSGSRWVVPRFVFSSKEIFEVLWRWGQLAPQGCKAPPQPSTPKYQSKTEGRMCPCKVIFFINTDVSSVGLSQISDKMQSNSDSAIAFVSTTCGVGQLLQSMKWCGADDLIPLLHLRDDTTESVTVKRRDDKDRCMAQCERERWFFHSVGVHHPHLLSPQLSGPARELSAAEHVTLVLNASPSFPPTPWLSPCVHSSIASAEAAEARAHGVNMAQGAALVALGEVHARHGRAMKAGKDDAPRYVRRYAPLVATESSFLQSQICLSDVFLMQYAPELVVPLEKFPWDAVSGGRADDELARLKRLVKKALKTSHAYSRLPRHQLTVGHPVRDAAMIEATQRLVKQMSSTRCVLSWRATDPAEPFIPRLAFCISYEHYLSKLCRLRGWQTSSRRPDLTMETLLRSTLLLLRHCGWALVFQDRHDTWPSAVRRDSYEVLFPDTATSSNSLLASVRQAVSALKETGGDVTTATWLTQVNSPTSPKVPPPARIVSSVSPEIWQAALVPESSSLLLWVGARVVFQNGRTGTVVGFRRAPRSFEKGEIDMILATCNAQEEQLSAGYREFVAFNAGRHWRQDLDRWQACLPAHQCDLERDEWPVVHLDGTYRVVLVLPTVVTRVAVQYPTTCFVSAQQQHVKYSCRYIDCEKPQDEQTAAATELLPIIMPTSSSRSDSCAQVAGSNKGEFVDLQWNLLQDGIQEQAPMVSVISLPLQLEVHETVTSVFLAAALLRWPTPVKQECTETRRKQKPFSAEVSNLGVKWCHLHLCRKRMILTDTSIHSSAATDIPLRTRRVASPEVSQSEYACIASFLRQNVLIGASKRG